MYNSSKFYNAVTNNILTYQKDFSIREKVTNGALKVPALQVMPESNEDSMEVC